MNEVIVIKLALSAVKYIDTVINIKKIKLRIIEFNFFDDFYKNKIQKLEHQNDKVSLIFLAHHP